VRIVPDAKPEVDLEDSQVQDLIRHLVDRDVVMVVTPSDRRPITEEELEMLHPQARENYLRAAIDPPDWWPDATPQREALKKLELVFKDGRPDVLSLQLDSRKKRPLQVRRDPD